MNKSSNNNEKIKVESGYADSLICKLEESNVRFELGPSEKLRLMVKPQSFRQFILTWIRCPNSESQENQTEFTVIQKWKLSANTMWRWQNRSSTLAPGIGNTPCQMLLQKLKPKKKLWACLKWSTRLIRYMMLSLPNTMLTQR